MLLGSAIRFTTERILHWLLLTRFTAQNSLPALGLRFKSTRTHPHSANETCQHWTWFHRLQGTSLTRWEDTNSWRLCSSSQGLRQGATRSTEGLNRNRLQRHGNSSSRSENVRLTTSGSGRQCMSERNSTSRIRTTSHSKSGGRSSRSMQLGIRLTFIAVILDGWRHGTGMLTHRRKESRLRILCHTKGMR